MFRYIIVIFLCTLVGQRDCWTQPDDEINLEKQAEWMNFSVDPCDNFFRFSCGKIAEAPEGSDLTDPIELKEKKIRNLIIHNLNKDEVDGDTDNIHVIKAAKNLFKSCFDFDRKYDRTFTRFVKNFLSQSIGGWPVLQGKLWNQTSFDWNKTIFPVGNIKYWKNVFIPLSVDPLSNDKIQYNTDLLGLDPSVLSSGNSSETIGNYLNVMIDTAVEFGADKYQAKSELTKVVEFEREFAQFIQDKSLVPTSFILKSSPNVRNHALRDYLKQLFPGNLFNDLFLSDNDIGVTLPSVFLNESLNFIEKTDQRVVANYIGWKMIEKISSYKKYFYKNNGEVDRSEQCFGLVKKLLPAAPAALYIRKYRDREGWQKIIGRAQSMVDEIRHKIITITENTTWMTEPLRSDAARKLDKVTFTFGFPPVLYNDTELNEWYRDLQIDTSNYFEIMTAISFFNEKFQFYRLTSNLGWMDYLPFVTHAHAVHIHNLENSLAPDIQISVGALRGFTFGLDHPQYMNYANLGVMVGQALVQSIRTLQSQVDPIIDLKCMGKHYDNFIPRNSWRNIVYSSLSWYPNLLDHIALKAAYLAYKSSEANDNAGRLSHQSYTADQMFWIAAAGRFCKKVGPLTTEFKQSKTQEPFNHPNELRVLIPLGSISNFSKDFSCQASSRMNPEEKCLKF